MGVTPTKLCHPIFVGVLFRYEVGLGALLVVGNGSDPLDVLLVGHRAWAWADAGAGAEGAADVDEEADSSPADSGVEDIVAAAVQRPEIDVLSDEQNLKQAARGIHTLTSIEKMLLGILAELAQAGR